MVVNKVQQMERRQTRPITLSCIWSEGRVRTGSVGELTAGARVGHQSKPEASGRSVLCVGAVTEGAELHENIHCNQGHIYCKQTREESK